MRLHFTGAALLFLVFSGGPATAQEAQPAAPATEQTAEQTDEGTGQDGAAEGIGTVETPEEKAAAAEGQERTTFSGPYDEAMYLIDGTLYPMGERKARVEKLLDELYKGGDRRFEVVFNLGIMALRNQQLDQAWAYFEEARNLPGINAGNRASCLARMGRIKAERGDVAAADQLMQQALTENEYCSAALDYMARKELASRNYEQALVLSRKALLGDPSNMNSYLTMALVYYATDRWDLGILVCESALKINPAASPIHNVLGLIYLKQNEIRKAYDQFQKAITADPDNLDARKNLAALVLNYKDFTSAVTLFENVLKADPKDMQMQVSYAVALRGVGRLEEARKVLEDELKVNPSDQDAAYNYCILLHEYISDYPAALDSCMRFQAMISSGHRKYDEMKRRIKGIREAIEVMNEVSKGKKQRSESAEEQQKAESPAAEQKPEGTEEQKPAETPATETPAADQKPEGTEEQKPAETPAAEAPASETPAAP